MRLGRGVGKYIRKGKSKGSYANALTVRPVTLSEHEKKGIQIVNNWKMRY